MQDNLLIDYNKIRRPSPNLEPKTQIKELQEQIKRKDIEFQLLQDEMRRASETIRNYQNKIAELSSKLMNRDDDFYAFSDKIEKLKDQHENILQNIKDQLANYNIDLSLIKGITMNESIESPRNLNGKHLSGSLVVSPILQSPPEPADWKLLEFQKEIDLLKEKLVSVTRERDSNKA